jgi:GTP cyclohydrolase I
MEIKNMEAEPAKAVSPFDCKKGDDPMSSTEYKNSLVGKNREQLEYHVREILRLLGEDVDREGLLETPARVTRMYEEIFAGYDADLRDVLGVTFDERHEELVIIKDIVYYSQCEHHMAPFFGKIHVGYIPSGKVAGLSKFARLVDAVTRKLQVQERITSEIADILEDVLKPHGVMVVVEGEHLCMCSRGVKKYGSKTITSGVRGSFRTDSTLRSEFLSLLK